MNESDAQAAVRVAREILDGSTPLLWGCRRICGPIQCLGLARMEPFATFIAVESETDHLPINPDERKLWNPQVLVKKEEEIAGFTEWARESVLAASRAVIRKFGE